MARDDFHAVYDMFCGTCPYSDEGRPSDECFPGCEVFNQTKKETIQTYQRDVGGQSLLDQFRKFQRIQNSLV